MSVSPLEAMYPNRCYDCLTVVPHDKLLCPGCEGLYAAERKRRGGEPGER